MGPTGLIGACKMSFDAEIMPRNIGKAPSTHSSDRHDGCWLILRYNGGSSKIYNLTQLRPNFNISERCGGALRQGTRVVNIERKPSKDMQFK